MLDIRTEDRGGYLLATVTGSLNFVTEGQLLAAVNPEIKRGQFRLLLDLRNLEYVDSSGLGGLLNLDQRVMMQRGAMAILRPAGPADRIFRIARMEKVLDLFRSRDEAERFLEEVQPNQIFPRKYRLLLLCQDPERVAWFQGTLASAGFHNVESTRTPEDAHRLLSREIFQALIIDEEEPIQSAQKFLEGLEGDNRNVPLVIVGPQPDRSVEDERESRQELVDSVTSALFGGERSYMDYMKTALRKRLIRS